MPYLPPFTQSVLVLRATSYFRHYILRPKALHCIATFRASLRGFFNV